MVEWGMTEIVEKDIHSEVVRLLNKLTPQGTATVVGLYGDLGSGKTTFTKALAEALGVKDTVTSPTFVLEKIYTLTNQKFSRNFLHLIHIDAYRLEDSAELKKLGWDTIVSDGNNLIVVEWADKIENILPQDTKKVIFEVIGENTRNISYA